MNTKEYRVYVCDAGYVKDLGISDFIIGTWNQGDTLPPEAEVFITTCEDLGFVYTLEAFQNVLNSGDFDLHINYVFITNKY